MCPTHTLKRHKEKANRKHTEAFMAAKSSGGWFWLIFIDCFVDKRKASVAICYPHSDHHRHHISPPGQMHHKRWLSLPKDEFRYLDSDHLGSSFTLNKSNKFVRQSWSYKISETVAVYNLSEFTIGQILFSSFKLVSCLIKATPSKTVSFEFPSLKDDV